MKAFFYCINGTGIGHIHRAYSIARAMLKIDPKAKILLATNGSYNPVKEREEIAFFKTSVTNLDMHRDPSLQKIEQEEIKNELLRFRPDVLVIDNKVPSFIGELGGMTKICILRAIREKHMKEYMSQYGPRFDYFLIPNSISELKSTYSKGFFRQIKANRKVRFIGPIVKDFKASRRQAATQFLVMFGGGGPHSAKRKGVFYNDVRTLADFFLHFFQDHFTSLPVKIVVGPNFDAEQFKSLKKRGSENGNITVVRQITDVIAEAKHSYVISLLGYNTVYELITSRIPAAYISKRGIAESQDDRGRWIQKQRMGIFIPKANKTNAILAIKKLLRYYATYERTLQSSAMKPMNKEAAKFILSTGRRYGKGFKQRVLEEA